MDEKKTRTKQPNAHNKQCFRKAAETNFSCGNNILWHCIGTQKYELLLLLVLVLVGGEKLTRKFTIDPILSVRVCVCTRNRVYIHLRRLAYNLLYAFLVGLSIGMIFFFIFNFFLLYFV